ncbi:MAG: outer membrane protein assembly factor BamA [Methylococcales bacterium]
MNYLYWAVYNMTGDGRVRSGIRIVFLCGLLSIVLLTSVSAIAAPFIIKDITVEGVQRLSPGTVFNYLPVTIGDRFDAEKSRAAIRALFKTGLFNDVSLEQDGDVLIIHVEERPAIASIEIKGNSDIKSDELIKALEGIGLAEGQVFNQQLLDKIEQELRRQYFSRGKYGVKLNTEVVPLSNNRVALTLNVAEGSPAKIQQINIVGNHLFKTKKLVNLFESSVSNWLSFYTKDDQYSRQKLSADLEHLRSYYLDRGYLDFEIESTQVSITPDKKEIYVTINVKEGEQFMVEEVRLAGDIIIDQEELLPLFQIGPQEIFSRKQASETSKLVTERLGEEGYTFANVNMIPDINKDENTVKLTFFVDPGKRAYVRNINITGNDRTRDEVIRREIRQMEAAWASAPKIEQSKQRLDRLGYFEEVNVETPAVTGTADQIDVNYSVVERPGGNLSAGVGFSQTQGLILNASITQENLFGTGKRLNLTFDNSSVNTVYRFGYHNPYFTINGVSFGYNLGFKKTDAEQANISNYSTDVINSGINFGIPLTENARIRFNFDYENTNLKTSTRTSEQILEFINDTNGVEDSCDTIATADQVSPVLDADGNEINPLTRQFSKCESRFNILTLGLGWSHTTIDRAIFPTSGGSQSLSASVAVPGLDLQYYKVEYRQRHYFPLAKDLVLSLNGHVAIGDGYGSTQDLPIFENYFTGGVQSVRGFDDNTLGPRDSRNDPLGGNRKIQGSAELIFPIPFFAEQKSLRLSAFADVGNVYADKFELGELRYSAGLGLKWLSPFGALSLSVAVPLNKGDNDETKPFQFSFGTAN